MFSTFSVSNYIVSTSNRGNIFKRNILFCFTELIQITHHQNQTKRGQSKKKTSLCVRIAQLTQNLFYEVNKSFYIAQYRKLDVGDFEAEGVLRDSSKNHQE